MSRHERPAPRLRAVHHRRRRDGGARRRASGRPPGRDAGRLVDDLASGRRRRPVVGAAQLHPAGVAGGPSEPRLRPHIQPDRLHRRSVRPARAARRRARRHPGVRRRRSRGGLRGRLDHAVRLLGAHGGGVAVRGVVRRHPAVAGGGIPLSPGPYPGRLAALLRHPGPPAARRRGRPGGADAKRHAGRRLLAHPSGGGRQRRGAAAARLADGCLPGGLGHRQRVPERLHHQDRRVRAHPPLPGRRGAAVGRRGDDAVRRGLRHPGKRHPPPAGLPHRQPGRLHGRRGGHGHGAGPERQRRARLLPHPLQGAPVHGRGSGDPGDGPAQAQRPGRPERRHAACLRAVHDRRAVHIRGAAVQRLHQQVDDRIGRRRGAPAAARAPADAGRRRHLSERRAEAALLHLHGRRPRPVGGAPAAEHAAGDGRGRLLLHLAGPLPAGAVRALAV